MNLQHTPIDVNRDCTAFTVRLRTVYEELNARCFGGTLPDCEIKGVPWEYLMRWGLRARCFPEIRKILVGDSLVDRDHRRELERVLLHEICHLEASGHGEAFKEQIRRLADRSQCAWVRDWARQECQEADQAERDLNASFRVAQVFGRLVADSRMRKRPWIMCDACSPTKLV